jgi:hypothetical protein
LLFAGGRGLPIAGNVFDAVEKRRAGTGSRFGLCATECGLLLVPLVRCFHDFFEQVYRRLFPLLADAFAEQPGAGLRGQLAGLAFWRALALAGQLASRRLGLTAFFCDSPSLAIGSAR